jgi:hypothetical protein
MMIAMLSFQLDQCSNNGKFADKCNSEKHCIVRRFPKRLMDFDDSIVLADLLARDGCFLTMDFMIVHENPAHIPPENPGIIVVRAVPNKSSIMERLIARFKRLFPRWASTDWSKIYLEIEESGIYLARLVDGNINGGRTVSFDSDDFSGRLQSALAQMRAC